MEQETTNNNNKNDVRVNNQFTINFNFGDSLNLLALIAGIYVIKKLIKSKSDKG